RSGRPTRGPRSTARYVPFREGGLVSRRLTALGVVPARLGSTRLPRKVLRDIAGKPLVVHVWEAARRSPDLAEVFVATDADEVVQACARHGVPAILTSADHPSGTDRVWRSPSRAPPTSTSTSRATNPSSRRATSRGSWTRSASGRTR